MFKLIRISESKFRQEHGFRNQNKDTNTNSKYKIKIHNPGTYKVLGK